MMLSKNKKRFGSSLLLLLVLGVSAVAGADDLSQQYFNNTAYLSWWQQEEEQQTQSYHKNLFLPASNGQSGAALFWTIHENSIDLALVVPATGWASFGISQAGGMLGADVFTLEARDPTTLVDGYILEDRAAPLVDCNSQDWTLAQDVQMLVDEEGEEEQASVLMMVQVSRLLDTNDAQDHVIVNDASPFTAPSRLIAAWGDTETVGYHGRNVARHAVKLFDEVTPLEIGRQADDAADVVLPADASGDRDALEARLQVQSDGYFEVRQDNYLIPSDTETTYHDVCQTADSIRAQVFDATGQNLTEDQTLTIIGYVPILSSPETEPFVHHFVVSGYSNTNCESLGTRAFGWAPGGYGLIMPDNVGFPMLGGDTEENPNSYFSLNINVHYDNRGLVDNMIDSSGVRVYYVFQPREHDAAYLTLADGALSLRGETIGSGLRDYGFECDASCSSSAMAEDTSVTVLMESFHMHETGIRMSNELIRNGEVVHHGAIDIFDFPQTGTFHVQQEPFEILPGDAFRTNCYFRDGTEFGLGSEEEMCIAFLMYYPAVKVPSILPGGSTMSWACVHGFGNPDCVATMTNTSLASTDELKRGFGVCPKDADEHGNSDHDHSSSEDEKEVSSAYGHLLQVVVGLLSIAATGWATL